MNIPLILRLSSTSPTCPQETWDQCGYKRSKVCLPEVSIHDLRRQRISRINQDISNANFSLQRIKDTYEFLISKSHVHPDFSHTYAGVSDSDKRVKISCVERLEKLGDTVIIAETEQSTATEKAKK